MLAVSSFLPKEFAGMTVPYPLATAATTLLVMYIAYVRAVRYRRRQQIEAMPDPLVAGFDTARKISKMTTQLEFPFIAAKSLEFGLFRTYGIPTISKTLSSTKQLTHEVGRRYDDTDLLLREITENEDADDPRVEMALRRMNFLHSKYKISNDDYLYTLSVFVWEPLRWVQRYEWREPTKNEVNAAYVYWREIGIRMGIKHIPDTPEGLSKFYDEYEEKYMKYADTNKKVADATVQLFLSVVPPLPGLRSLGNVIVRGLMDRRLLDTFGMAPAPEWLQNFLKSVLLIRAFVIRNFFIPRSKPLHRIPDKAVKGTNPAVYCPLFTVFEKTYPEGYSIEKLGPKKFENDPTLGKIHERVADSILKTQ